LIPKINCYHKKCSKKQKGLFDLSDTNSNTLKCNPFPINVITNDIKGHELDQCYITFKDNFIFSHHQLPTENKNINKNNKKINIGIKINQKLGIGFPATSRNIPNPSIVNIPFFTILLPSILDTIDKDNQLYYYNLYLGILFLIKKGFDTGDEYYVK
jgi:hypothetical protein